MQEDATPLTRGEFKQDMKRLANELAQLKVSSPTKITKPAKPKPSIDKKHGDKIEALERRIRRMEKKIKTLERQLKSKTMKKSTTKAKRKTIRRKRKVAPDKMIFPTGEEYDIRNWNDIVKSTMSYLLNNGKFNLTDHLRGFVNTEPKTLAGKDYRNHWKMEKYYIELHGSAQNHIDRADLILKSHKINPEKIKYEEKPKVS